MLFIANIACFDSAHYQQEMAISVHSKRIIISMQSELNNETLRIPAKLYRIGELVDYTPFSRQTIHNYTIMGLIREAKWTEGGHRLYDESVFERLSEIIRLRKTKTLLEIREALRRKDGRDSQIRKISEKGRIEHESDVTDNG